MFKKIFRNPKIVASIPDWLLNPPKNLTSGSRTEIMKKVFLDSFNDKPIKGIEVGVWRGEGSTQIWLKNCAPNSEFLLIDQWEPDITEFMPPDLSLDERLLYSALNLTTTENFLASFLAIKDIERVRVKDFLEINLVRGDSNNYLKLLKENNFDFIYLDGDHRYSAIKTDLLNSKKLIKKEFGIICGDDLEKQPTLELYKESLMHKGVDLLRDPNKNYHPGVLASIWEEFNEGVNMVDGFWWIYCINGSFSKNI